MDIKELGRQVQAKRKENKLSQEQLAKKAGVSRNYISYIERGEARRVSVEVINQLAIALGVSSAQLTGESAMVMIPPSFREFGIQKNLSYEVIDKMAHIPPRGKVPNTREGWEKLYNAISPFIETKPGDTN